MIHCHILIYLGDFRLFTRLHERSLFSTYMTDIILFQSLIHLERFDTKYPRRTNYIDISHEYILGIQNCVLVVNLVYILFVINKGFIQMHSFKFALIA